MGQEETVRTVPQVTLEGELAPLPRGPWLTGLMAITGVLVMREVSLLLLRHVLVFRRPAEIRLVPSGIEVRGRTSMLGKVLREHTSVIPREGLVRVTREVRFPSAAMYAGLFALALGSYVGVGLVVDGVRAASPSMLGVGLMVALFGLALDFTLTSLVPGLKGRTRVVFVPRRGGVLCVGSVNPSRANRLLAALAKSERRTASPSSPAVSVGAELGTDPSESQARDESP